MVWIIYLIYLLSICSIQGKIKKRYSLLWDRDSDPYNYDIESWTKTLDLEECVIVEIGEEFCSIFIEKIEPLKEFFLGLCPCATLYKWSFCDSKLTKLRPDDCTLRDTPEIENSGARVHRRLCNIGVLSKASPRKHPPCNCSLSFAGQNLYQVKGFPTCFRSPLPDAICSPRSVCGVAQCQPITYTYIHGVLCDPQCHQKQPFCEEVGPSTSARRALTSHWSSWSEPQCNSTFDDGVLFSISTCLNKQNKYALDCIHKPKDCCNCKILRNSHGLTLIKEIAPCHYLNNRKHHQRSDKYKEMRTCFSNTKT